MIIKYNSLICSFLLVIAIFHLPIPYYTFLRIIVMIGAILIVIRSSTQKEYLWAAVFLVIGILFNPFVPIYLYQKLKWVWVDILVALLFLMDFYHPKPKEKTTHSKQTIRKYNRDKIY